MSPIEPPNSRTPIRAVLIAGAGAVGLAGATALLEHLPELRSPIIVSVRDANIDSLQTRIDGVRTRWASEGALLEDASLWIAPSGKHTYVRNGRFELTGAEDTTPASTPSLGKLYHSLRVEFGSRVFAVVIDETEPNPPALRLLAQRGAKVVSPLEFGPDDIARHWTSDEIAAYLSDTIALAPADAVAIA